MTLDTEFAILAGQIAEQHTQIFPKATISTQMVKLSEEMKEFLAATTIIDRENEGGDVLYVIISLLRFPSIKAVTDFLLYNFFYSKNPVTKKNLIRILKLTMKKVADRNEKGAYYWSNGCYKRNKKLSGVK